jgi:hypothetical protein
MKIKITLKDPDGFYDAIGDAIQDSISQIEGLTDDEKEALEETRRDEMNEILSEWVEYNEYVTIEFDTDAKTATVIPL